MKNENFHFWQIFHFLFFSEKWVTKNKKSIFFIFCQIFAIFDDFSTSSAHSTLKNCKNLAKNEEKPCPEIFTSQKLKFSAKLVEKNAILTNFKWDFFPIFFCFSRKMAQKFSFFAKNENAKKWDPYSLTKKER